MYLDSTRFRILFLPVWMSACTAYITIQRRRSHSNNGFLSRFTARVACALSLKIGCCALRRCQRVVQECPSFRLSVFFVLSAMFQTISSALAGALLVQSVMWYGVSALNTKLRKLSFQSNKEPIYHVIALQSNANSILSTPAEPVGISTPPRTTPKTRQDMTRLSSKMAR